MKKVWKVALAVVALVMIGVSDVEHVHAQQFISPAVHTAISFSGDVTVNGELPTYSGFSITARIGDEYESPSVAVGINPANPFRYEHLLVWPPSILRYDLIGSQIEFWINGEVKSTVTDWYAIVEPCAASNSLCPKSGAWAFGIIREVDLDFPNLPDPEPIPDANPTPLPTVEPAPETVATPDISKLRVGGSAIPPTFALIAMLTGLSLVLLGSVAFSRRDRVRKQE